MPEEQLVREAEQLVRKYLAEALTKDKRYATPWKIIIVQQDGGTKTIECN